MIDTINIVFRFLDFFVIVGVIFYGMKHYIIPAVEKMLREYGVFIYNLESDCKNLQLQTQSIYENMQDQDRHFQAMQARFAIWQKKCNERIAAQKLEQEKTDQMMQNRFEIRSEFIRNDNFVQQQLPMILDATTKILQNKYHVVDKQKEYIATLIHVMKEQS
jgi:hypothetical protein